MDVIAVILVPAWITKFVSVSVVITVVKVGTVVTCMACSGSVLVFVFLMYRMVGLVVRSLMWYAMLIILWLVVLNRLWLVVLSMMWFMLHAPGIVVGMRVMSVVNIVGPCSSIISGVVDVMV